MAKYLITYDLRAPGRKYDTLVAALRKAGCVPIAESVWLGNLQGNALGVRDNIRALVDANDRVVVIELKPGDWAVWQGFTEGIAWLEANL
ncbi:hypothetical protein [Caulobacter sp. B11]|uniref:hypothetical protein n=1 Tax=Caulobacter sp. B11 TaxID=2048899 RepID=UPI00117CECC2|nr:hypothetical protein [Caulobacter sp. B11]